MQSDPCLCGRRLLIRLEPGDKVFIGIAQWCAVITIFLVRLVKMMCDPAGCLLQRPIAIMCDVLSQLSGEFDKGDHSLAFGFFSACLVSSAASVASVSSSAASAA